MRRIRSHFHELVENILLSRVAIEMCQRMGFAPDVFHCHDWHTALIPLYLKTLYAWDLLFANTRSVLTIHNIAYQESGVDRRLFEFVGVAGTEISEAIPRECFA